MNYYIAIETLDKPFIIWAKTERDDLNRLIIPENEIPAYRFGVCPLRIESGELIERSVEDMAIYENEFNEKKKIESYKNTTSKLDTESFTFDSLFFPMNETARIYYNLMQQIPSDYRVMTTTGSIYDLVDDDREAFIFAYNTRLKNLIAPK